MPTATLNTAARARLRGLALFSGGFRPFFLFGALWAAIALPVWLAAFFGGHAPSAMPAMTWHAHEMVYGYAITAVAGFLLTAIPNWTGRLPLRGAPLAGLAALWLAGRLALLCSATLGAALAMAIDLAFLAVFMLVVARELIAGRNFRNLPILAALGVLLAGNTLVHLEAIGVAPTALLGNHLGIATLGALIALVGGRIVPSFTRNWLARLRPGARMPASPSRLDLACLVVTVAGLAAWVAFPDSRIGASLQVAGGAAAALRLSRWRGLAAVREPLLIVLHMGYAWLAAGLVLLGLNSFFAWLPPSAGVHALTVGAIGTMTLAVMTRATLGHTGRPLAATPGTVAIYALVSLAAVLRLAAAVGGAHYALLVSLAGASWTGAFGLFAALYGPMLLEPRGGRA